MRNNAKKIRTNYNCKFVDSSNEADVIFTNDIFPSKLLDTVKPKVKRMDGVFWQNSLKSRNIPYNAAAQAADRVIFTSNYSKNTYEYLYGHNISSAVAVNAVDPEIFYCRPSAIKDHPVKWLAVATNWNRPEKRIKAILDFADKLRNNPLTSCQEVTIIGDSTLSLVIPNNVRFVSYTANIVEHYLTHDALINLSYRDASPKVVSEAQACGLPVLYANSGGVRELVDSGHVFIDSIEKSFEDNVPDISIQQSVINGFYANYEYLKYAAMKYNSSFRAHNMLQIYFDTFRSFL